MFVNPVKAQGLLNTAEVSNIFSNITLILTINTELMNDLLKIKKSKPSTQNIGEIFLKLVLTHSLFPSLFISTTPPDFTLFPPYRRTTSRCTPSTAPTRGARLPR